MRQLQFGVVFGASEVPTMAPELVEVRQQELSEPEQTTVRQQEHL